MNDLFISHSSKDKDYLVRALATELRAKKLDIWIDEDVILSGDNILDEIEKGIENSLCVVLILTAAFFQSRWTSLELGLARGQKSNCAVIPVLAGISAEEVACKYPFLLTYKYIGLDPNNISVGVDSLASSVEKIRARKLLEEPLDYQKTVRKLNNIDSPISNTISILVTEYTQISKISIPAGITHASKIGIAIIDDVYSRVKSPSDKSTLTWEEKLDILLQRYSGLNRNISEHLAAIMKIPASHYLPIETDQKKLIDLSLAAVLNWYLSYVSITYWKGTDSDHYEVVLPTELCYLDFIEMYEIDKLVLRSDLIAPPEVTYKWYQCNIYSHIAVRSAKTKQIAGYFAILPVTDELFQKIQSGEFKDNDLTTDGIRQYDMQDFYKLYVASVCIHPQHQNTMAFNRLYHALVEMMFELASEREIYITDIITEASTEQGEKLCKILGLRKLMDTNLDTKLYIASLLPPSLRLNSLFGHKLIKFYQSKYDDMKELF